MANDSCMARIYTSVETSEVIKYFQPLLFLLQVLNQVILISIYFMIILRF